jgi:hypothetical protein
VRGLFGCDLCWDWDAVALEVRNTGASIWQGHAQRGAALSEDYIDNCLLGHVSFKLAVFTEFTRRSWKLEQLSV